MSLFTREQREGWGKEEGRLWARWGLGTKEGISDEQWGLYVSDESPNSIPETSITLYGNQLLFK